MMIVDVGMWGGGDLDSGSLSDATEVGVAKRTFGLRGRGRGNGVGIELPRWNG